MVVVQDAEAVAVGDRGDEQIDGREPVVADTGELALRVERPSLDLLVDGEVGESQQLVKQIAMVSSVASGVAGLEQEGQTGRNVAGLERVRDLARARVAE